MPVCINDVSIISRWKKTSVSYWNKNCLHRESTKAQKNEQTHLLEGELAIPVCGVGTCVLLNVRVLVIVDADAAVTQLCGQVLHDACLARARDEKVNIQEWESLKENTVYRVAVVINRKRFTVVNRSALVEKTENRLDGWKTSTRYDMNTLESFWGAKRPLKDVPQWQRRLRIQT